MTVWKKNQAQEGFEEASELYEFKNMWHFQIHLVFYIPL